ncbi:hypothetical protein KKG66_11600 [bacterium]|nr:hypothetical protein [bacterium]RQV95008.1 MAG: hypothetical protein EH220_06685 [bacterium]
MSIRRIPLRVGEILLATVRRKLTRQRVLITLKGQSLVAEPEYPVSPGDQIEVQVLSIFPRIRLRLLPGATPPKPSQPDLPMDLHT